MERHPYFDLWLHTDEELSALVGERIVERRTLHEWPLSSVQIISFEGGEKQVYKAQLRQSSVEPDFYCAASSPLLLAHRGFPDVGNTCFLMIDWEDAPTLKGSALDEKQTLRTSKRLIEEICQIKGDVPVYLDLSSHSRWLIFAERILQVSRELVSGQKFTKVNQDSLAYLDQWSQSPAVTHLFDRPPHLNHGDLRGENVLALPDGYRIIDWQRPNYAPVDLDLVDWLIDFGFNPLHHVDVETYRMALFIQLAWFVECRAVYFPAGDVYDHTVAGLVAQMRGL